MTRTNALIVLVVLLLFVSGFGALQAIELGNHLAADEATTRLSDHKACVVQKYGLEAQAFLTGSLDDIHRLLTLPQTPAARQHAAATVPPAELAREIAIVRQLNANLEAYARAIAKRPKARTCS